MDNIERMLYRLIMRQNGQGKLDKSMLKWFDNYVENMDEEDKAEHQYEVELDKIFDTIYKNRPEN